MQHASTEQVCNWIDQFVAGDKQCFRELITHLENRLRISAHHVLKHVSGGGQGICETDDLLQDLVVRLLTRCESIAASLKTVPSEQRVRYFFGCTAKLIRNLISEETRRPLVRRSKSLKPDAIRGDNNESELGDYFASISIGDSSSPERIAMWADFHEFLDGLPEDLREVADLFWYHGLTHSDVGATLGIAAVTSRQRWAKVRHLALERFAQSPFG
jgi:RNA polymerase sigma factor (sigma-70 family)